MAYMHIEKDPSVDAAYIYVEEEPGDIVETLEIRSDIIADFDAHGKLVGIEVLNASKNLPTNVLKQTRRTGATA